MYNIFVIPVLDISFKLSTERVYQQNISMIASKNQMVGSRITMLISKGLMTKEENVVFPRNVNNLKKFKKTHISIKYF